MTPKSREIGDPLEQVAATGKIGGRTSSTPAIQPVESLDTQTAKSLKVQNAKGGRVQQTIYLPPDLAKWIKIQAIEEGREISEVAADALALYRQSH